MPEPTCGQCGRVPAADVTFRETRGYLLFRRTITHRGPFCRDCGIATFRRAASDMLLRGWWSIVSLVMMLPYAQENATAHRTVRQLGAPQKTKAGGAPFFVGQPVFRRWRSYGFLLPIVAVAGIVVGIAHVRSEPGRSTAPTIGSCVRQMPNDQSTFVGCGQAHDGIVVNIVTSAAECSPATDWVVLLSDATSRLVYYCVEDSAR